MTEQVRIEISLAGDCILLFAFVFIGRASHHELSAGGLTSTVGTSAPFIFGWLFMARLLRSTVRRRPLTVGQAVRWVLRAWPPALLVALAIRAAIELRLPAPAFVVVALLFNAVTLSVWRSGLTAVSQRMNCLQDD